MRFQSGTLRRFEFRDSSGVAYGGIVAAWRLVMNALRELESRWFASRWSDKAQSRRNCCHTAKDGKTGETKSRSLQSALCDAESSELSMTEAVPVCGGVG